MKYFILEPEVSGELGTNTIIDSNKHPPVIHKLHFVFTGWLGDDLIECFPCYLISERLKLALENSNLSGFYVEECEIQDSEEMLELQPEIQLSQFYWLKVELNLNLDFYINNESKLVITEKAYKLLQAFNLNYCDITPM